MSVKKSHDQVGFPNNARMILPGFREGHPERCTTLACRLFQAENKQDPKDSGRTFELPPNCLKKTLR